MTGLVQIHTIFAKFMRIVANSYKFVRMTYTFAPKLTRHGGLDESYERGHTN